MENKNCHNCKWGKEENPKICKNKYSGNYKYHVYKHDICECWEEIKKEEKEEQKYLYEGMNIK